MTKYVSFNSKLLLLIFCFKISHEKVCKEKDLISDLNRKNPKFYKNEILSTKVISWTPRSVLQALTNCTVYYGNIKITKESFYDYGYGEHVRVKDLENVKNLREIYGCVYLNLIKYPEIRSLWFFPILRKIETSHRSGFTLIQSKVEAIDFSNIHLNVPFIGIGYNDRLCYLDRIRTVNSSSRYLIRDNKDPSICRYEGKVCSGSCNPAKGCWGPTDRHCFECREWKAGSDCVKTCESRREFFTPTTGRICGKCHSSCAYGCFGATEKECYSGIDHCPKYKYFNKTSRSCEECSLKCFGNGFDKRSQLTVAACSGAGDFTGPGGCSFKCPVKSALTVTSDGQLQCDDAELIRFHVKQNNTMEEMKGNHTKTMDKLKGIHAKTMEEVHGISKRLKERVMKDNIKIKELRKIQNDVLAQLKLSVYQFSTMSSKRNVKLQRIFRRAGEFVKNKVITLEDLERNENKKIKESIRNLERLEDLQRLQGKALEELQNDEKEIWETLRKRQCQELKTISKPFIIIMIMIVLLTVVLYTALFSCLKYRRINQRGSSGERKANFKDKTPAEIVLVDGDGTSEPYVGIDQPMIAKKAPSTRQTYANNAGNGTLKLR